MRLRCGFGVGAIAAVAALSGVYAPAKADPVADFYKGKTVKIIVGFGVGGGYDIYGRLAADHLGRFIPGNPTVIVENMPGGGGVRAASFLHSAAPKDGSVLSVIVQSIAFDSAIGELPGKIDASRYNFIGRLTSNVEAQFTWHMSKTKTLEDAKRQEVIVGATGAASPSSVVPRMLNEAIGARFKIVQGYPGTAEAALAMERGEVEGMMQSVESLQSAKPDWIADKKINFIWQLALKPHKDFPDVPAVGQLGDTPDDQAMLKLIAGTADIGRSLVAPPDVPAERLKALRAAFQAMVADEQFRAAAKARNTNLDPAPGEALQEIVAAAMATPKPVIEKTRAIVTAK